MADGVIARPGNFEHVTKMGRIEPRFAQPKSEPKPLFRRLPVKHFEAPDRSQSISTDPIRSVPRHVQKQPYMEMKLGRNMRAAPKGSIPLSPPNPQLDREASEPLLHYQPCSSNPVSDYYTNIHPRLTSPSSGPGVLPDSAAFRSIIIPQHPSPALIETLNRNHLRSTIPPTWQQEQQPPTGSQAQSTTAGNHVFAAPQHGLPEVQDLPQAGGKPEPGNRKTDINETERERIIQAKRAELEYGLRTSLKPQNMITTQAEINSPPKDGSLSTNIPDASAVPTLAPPATSLLYSFKMEGRSNGPVTSTQNGSALNESKPNTLALQKHGTGEEVAEIVDEIEAGAGNDDDDDGFNF